ncbi:Sodium/hydrogen exchanger family-domain-containing protein [Biscogniauxia sp. FL1348]|nr:Sodium/hydrogen exchanger family-domain-containing protein [Biscogniauxia sp. FL1348]
MGDIVMAAETISSASVSSTPSPSSLPYHEPSIVEILILSSFCLALNAVNSVLDATLYCGLVGQVLIGTAWGVSGAGWLDDAVQEAVVKIGYLGLLLVVYEGGLSTSVNTIRANLALSMCVALTGIAAPIGFSFLLGPIAFNATPIQCFAAGAALCSTSLGTTFTVLKTSGLTTTRLGAVLSAAAMMDDVAGLVMVQIVASGLSGDGSTGIAPGAIVRPVLVSLALAIVIPAAFRYVFRPAAIFLGDWRRSQRKEMGSIWRLIDTKEATFVTHTMLLIALITAASWAGASVLLSAYIAGVMVTWCDSQTDRTPRHQESSSGTITAASSIEPNEPSVLPARGERANDGHNALAGPSCESQLDSDADPSAIVTPSQPVMAPEIQVSRCTGQDIYDMYYAQAVNRILKPFFFASIGFSIPVSKMFSREVVWRGIIYSVLMVIGKLVCGVWLVRFPTTVVGLGKAIGRSISITCNKYLARIRQLVFISKPKQHVPSAAPTRPIEMAGGQSSNLASSQATQPAPPPSNTQEPAKPISLYPPAILASAMVARGEIGFLISAIAESKGVFRLPGEKSSDVSQLFLIVTWAIVLCTIVGPLCVGMLVKRLKRLEKSSEPRRGERDVLGVWGVQ